MATFNCIVTNAGRNLIATAMSGGQTVNLVNVKTGNGQIGGGDAHNLTSLINDIQDYAVDGSNSLTPYQTSVQFTVNSANVSNTYQMYEVGLMAKIGTGGTPVLLWYGYTTTPDTITPSGSSNATIDINQLAIVYSNATSCVATQTPTVTVPPHAITHIQDSTDVTSGFDPIPVADNTSTGLVPAAIGSAGHMILANTSPVSWIPYTPFITLDTTLYVDPSYNNVSPNFSSIQNAMNYLYGFNIASGVAVTISVNAAIYSSSTTINLTHLSGQNIKIQGTAYPNVTWSGVGTITGSANNWSVQLTNCSSVTNVHINNYVLVHYSTGGATLQSLLLQGFFKVTNVSGSTVTISVPYYAASWPSMAGCSGSLQPINTILSMGQNAGVYCAAPGIGKFSNFGIVAATPPNTIASGLNLVGNSNIYYCGTSGYIFSPDSFGISQGDCTCSYYRCAATNNQFGFSVGAGTAYFTQCTASFNKVFGFWFEGASCNSSGDAGVFAATTAVGNLSYGIQSDTSRMIAVSYYSGGVVYSGLWTSSYNNSFGVSFGNQSSSLGSNSNCYLYASNNVTYDLYIANLSSWSMAVLGTRIFNQAVNTLTLNGAIYS